MELSTELARMKLCNGSRRNMMEQFTIDYLNELFAKISIKLKNEKENFIF